MKVKRCTCLVISAAARSVRRVGGPPLSPQDAVHFLQGCRWKTQADQMEGPASEKQTHNTDTHAQSVYSATMDNSTVMSSGFPPAGEDKKKKLCEEVANHLVNTQSSSLLVFGVGPYLFNKM